eukprot:g1397.t1
MPPPDLSHHESLALSQAKALARAGIDPNEASTASAFLEDELGGFYHRLGQGGQEKQQSKRDAEMQLDAAHAFDNSSSSADAEDGASTQLDVEKLAHFRCANGSSMFTKAWGSRSSQRKALALHGYLDNTGTFDLLGPALAKEGFEFVAMDFPGHGRSDHMSKDSWYSILDYPEYVIEAARSLGWDRFSLVGHSLGGAVASLVAASFPEKIERCVFLDILGPYAFTPGTSPKRLRTSIASRRALLDKEPKPYPSFDEAVKTRLKSVTMWGEGQTMSWDGAVRLVKGGTKPWEGDGQVKFTNDVRLRASSSSYLTEDSVLTYLRAIESDCLLVRGETGMLANADEVPTFMARKEAFGPRLKDLVLPGSHHLHLDDDTAPLVASHTAAFLRGEDYQELVREGEEGSSVSSNL